MSVHVSSQVVISGGGQAQEPEVYQDLEALIKQLSGESMLEWNPWSPEHLDVRPSVHNVDTDVTVTKTPVSPVCHLSRNRVVRHGQRLSRSSVGSDSTRPLTPVSPIANGAWPTNENVTATRIPVHKVEARESDEHQVYPDGSWLLPPDEVSDDRAIAGGALHQETPKSDLERNPRLQTTHQPPSPTLSQASYTTAAEETTQPHSISGLGRSHITAVPGPKHSWRSVSPPSFSSAGSSSTATRSARNESGDDLFKRFKAAIRAKTKLKRSKEWWEYENGASLNRICRAQNAFLPGTPIANADHSERGGGVSPDATNLVPQALTIPPQPKRPAPSIPQASTRLPSPAGGECDQREESILALQAQIEALQRQIASLEQLPASETLSSTVAGPSQSKEPYAECSVCGESLPLTFFTSRITANCAHSTHTCHSCLSQWISTCLEGRGWDNIKCPECPELLQNHDVKRSAEAEVFQRYDALATRAFLSTLPDFMWCTASGCGSGQLHLESSGPLFKCAACGHKTCIKHNLWHGGETCREYEYRTGLDGGKKQKEEEASEAKLKKMSKACPGRGCGWRIEKNAGCDHMTCRKCKYEFCWQCMADYKSIRKEGNSAHRRSCKYHSSNIR